MAGQGRQDSKEGEDMFNVVPIYHKLRGLEVNCYDKSYLTTPRAVLASISLKDGIIKDSEISVTRNFFDLDSERFFLALCAYGYDNLSDEIPIPSSPTNWEGITYMSRVTHTWHIKTFYEADASQVRLEDHAKEYFKELGKQLNQAKSDENQLEVVSSFFTKFGSHLSIGPYETGGRCVTKVSRSMLQGLDKKEVWHLLEEEFKSLKLSEADISPSDEETERDVCAAFQRQVCLFGGNDNCRDVDKWKRDLAESNLVISGDVSESNLLPIWEILKESNNVDMLGNLGVLYDSLRDVWSQTQDASADLYLPPLKVCSDERNRIPKVFDDLKLDKKKQGILQATTLRKLVSEEIGNTENVVMWKFIRSICSLDCRGRKCVKLAKVNLPQSSIEQRSFGGDIFNMVDFGGEGCENEFDIVSAMDITFAILHCCDPFLRQELLWKMAECRLAVPILLPYCDDKPEVQLWGLRKVYKSWMSKLAGSYVETSIIDYPLPIVSFLRLGDISVSKSRLLNKILGKVQGNNDHTCFVDLDEEPPCAKWSKGTIEAAWYLPEDTVDPQNASILLDAVTFFNIRGNALELPVQMDFACQASDVVVLMVEESHYKSFRSEIKKVSEKVRKHVICLISSTNHKRHFNTIEGDRETLMFSKPFLADVGEEICKKLCCVLWAKDGTSSCKYKSIDSLKSLCRELNIDIDEDKEGCISGKKVAKEIITSIRQCSESYKATNLPLRGKVWHTWCKLDKSWNKGYDDKFSSVEHYRDDLREKLKIEREKQCRTVPSDDIIKFIETLKGPFTTRRYFVAWLNLYLNDFCHEHLGPLRKELEKIQDESRDITTEKSQLKDSKRVDDDIKCKITVLIEREISLQQRASDIVKKIGKCSLGIEHFVREIGQHYETYDELKSLKVIRVDSKIDYTSLPKVAVNLLLDGYPLEILDGEVGQVPLRWVTAVFKSLIRRLGDVRVCAISVLGIQSSGKSTLLNCMFGVRFAVSAGRCTRGVFIQLLKVHENLKKEINCDYVIVIDTEGLKAPGRSQGYDLQYDNELATFALCLADLTLINIAGQTVGKDMTDVLQIAAHAFIRMKEVNIKSSCRIVQQFVADLGAVDKNKETTQAILNTLDEAISAAATAEGYGDLYSRFGDIFHLKRDEDNQYIPSLWQGTMAPPNHRYSEKILKLKEVLFRDLKDSGRTLSQFLDRLTNVWNAVKVENFIFGFETSTAAVQYKIFQHAYGGWVGEMRRTIMEWESIAKQKIKSVSSNKAEATKRNLTLEICEVVDEATAKVEELVKGYLSDDTQHGDDQLVKFKQEFLKDLQLTNRIFKQDAKESLSRIANSIAQKNQMQFLLPKCRNQLLEKAKIEAVKLRQGYVDKESLEDTKMKSEINTAFDKLWDEWMADICREYPPVEKKESDVKAEFDSYLFIQVGQKSDLSNDIKERLLKKDKPLLRRVKLGTLGCISGNQNNPKDVAKEIIEGSLLGLQMEIEDDRAYDPQIKHHLIESAINALNKSITEQV